MIPNIRRVIGRLLLCWRRAVVSLLLLRLRFSATIHGGAVEIGRGVTIYHPVRFLGRGRLILEDGVTLGCPGATSSRRPIMLQPREPEATIRIGRGSAIGNGAELIARTRIEIGENCLLGPRCIILDADFHGATPSCRSQVGSSFPVVLGPNVWLGLEVVVLKGVRIGRDSVVGARAVLTRSLPERSLAVSPQPAVILKAWPGQASGREAGNPEPDRKDGVNIENLDDGRHREQ